ncbi:MAG: hypothetical protein OCU18_03950 [Candidatus Syntrophoarchaeum sp.]|nr:hypothetical protein [Candidatus Syntrophoarchaeum sp.]
MTEKQDNTQSENQDNTQSEEKMVEIPEDSFNALLDKLDLLESASLEKRNDVDALAEEAELVDERETDDSVDYESMTRAELVNVIKQAVVEDVRDTYIKPLAIKQDAQRISIEIDRIMRKPGYEDFLDYSDEILATAKENPNLPLEKIYKLVKDDRPEEEKTTTNKRLLRHLPKGAQPYTGEKPSISTSNVSSPKNPKSLRDAASMAYEKILAEK